MFKSVRSTRALTTRAEIQMTPLIDMVFILLIFFLVTTSFVTETGIRVERPQARSSDTPPRRSIPVTVRADGQIVLEGRSVDLSAIKPYLERLRWSEPELAAVIRADRVIPLGQIVQVMDEIRAAGVRDIAVATEAKE